MIGKIVQFFRLKVFRISRYRWDYQYSKGMWDGLRDKEMDRIIVAEEMLNRYAKIGNILEIGCGEGIFYNHINENIYTFYEGIDISSVAIDKTKPNSKTIFEAADMETYIPSKLKYSVIVFNEVLFYSKNPVQLVDRYIKFLDESGILLIGMYDTPKSVIIWKDILKQYTILETKNIHQDGKSWTYKVLISKN